MKKYTLIVSGNNRFSISNETDCDAMTDYFPGIWAIDTQKRALKYAKEYIAEGNEVTVKAYNARDYALANKFIKELELKQTLFVEPAAVAPGVVTNGKPSTLGALKKFLAVGTKIKVVNAEFPDRSRDTFVKKLQTTSVVVDKAGGNSWIEFGKASDWSFSNTGATLNYINREGKVVPSITIEYI